MSAYRERTKSRGQPLWALGGILLCWIAARSALFEFPEGLLPEPMEHVRSIIGIVRDGDAPAVSLTDERPPLMQWELRPGSLAGPLLRASPVSEIASGVPLDQPVAVPEPPQKAAAHNILWMAGMSDVPLLPEVATALRFPVPAAIRSDLEAAQRARKDRWSGDAWLAWRAGPAGLAASGPAAPVYGASQAGAVLRYRLAPASKTGAFAYLRAVHALEVREGDLATGLGVRPLAHVPVTLHGEARTSRRGSSVTVRPAVFVSGGADAIPLPQGFAARGYAQAGYVGGSDATGFADGMLVAEKPVWRAPDNELAGGAGLWGGAQRGTSRLDLGPTASLRFRVGDGIARVSADYRLRVAGNAEPASGAALTLTAGF